MSRRDPSHHVSPSHANLHHRRPRIFRSDACRGGKLHSQIANGSFGAGFSRCCTTACGRSEAVAESVFFDPSRHEQYPFRGTNWRRGSGVQSQVVKNVGDVPTAVDNTDNLDDAGTLPVEDKILTVRKQS